MVGMGVGVKVGVVVGKGVAVKVAVGARVSVGNGAVAVTGADVGAETGAQLVTLCLFEHNWMRPHLALREKATGLPEGRRYRQRTPAMAIGLTDHLWTWEEFLTFRVNHYETG